MKWGEYSSDVQFILQQSESKVTTTAAAQAPPTVSSPTSVTQPINRQKAITETGVANESKTIINPLQQPLFPGKVVDLNNLDTYQNLDQKKVIEFKENIGVVRGIQQHQQQKPNASPVMQHVKPAGFVLPTVLNHPQHSPASSHSAQSSMDSNSFAPPPKKNFNSMDVRNNLVDRLCTATTTASTTTDAVVIVQNRPHSPIISKNGALVPPPYRDPPPPASATTSPSSTTTSTAPQEDQNLHELLPQGGMVAVNQYRDLVQLIKLQRDQMAVQQGDLSKMDQEIQMLEQRDRENASQMEALARDIVEQDQLLRSGADQLQALQYVEEEHELMQQQEKTLGAEMTLLRSKLANCETELLQCRNKVKLLVDDIQLEQRAMQFESRTQMEAQILGEVERLQGDIEHIVKRSEGTIGATAALKHEISFIEGAIADKKKQVEQLVHEMKEVNLKSLSAVQPSEEIRHLLEGGASRPGSTRRIIGSPRQLENAVPTSKNPHGVWV